MPDREDNIDDFVSRLRDGDGEDNEGLAKLLREQPEHRERFLKQMFLSGLLREAFGGSETVAAPRRRRWIVPALAAAAALVLAAVALWPRVDPALVATLSSVDGPILIDDLEAAVGAEIVPGQSVELLSENSTATLSYPDGTTVLIDGEAALTLADVGHKHIAVASGVLHADVAKQPSGKPMRIVTPSAELEIVGTRFVVGAMGDETDLNVTEGLVRMTRTDGETAEVSAGERARFSALFKLEITELPEVPDTWILDLEDPNETTRELGGERITDDLPAGSQGGLVTVPWDYDGRTYHRIGMRDRVDGLCKITENTHFRLTFRTRGWFNIFLYTLGPDENGQLQVRKYKLGASNLNRLIKVRDEWHTLVVPISAFTERTGDKRAYDDSGNKNEHIGFGGPPPEVGHVIRTIQLGHPEPQSDLRIDAIGFTPDGPGEKIMTTLDR